MQKQNKPTRVSPEEYQQYSSTSPEQTMSLWPGIILAFIMYYGGYTYMNTLYTGIILLIFALGWDWLIRKIMDVLIIRGTPFVAAMTTVLFGVWLAIELPVWWLAVGCVLYVVVMIYKK
jgi:ABC-type amino acid transport system permease subunit